MNRSSNRFLRILVFLALAIAGWAIYSFFAMPPVRPHVGDGRFKNTSWRFPWVTVGIPVPGYEINFDEFELGNDFDATYHIEQLPNFGGELGIYLSVVDPRHELQSDESRHKLNASVDIEVVDGDGKRVCQVQQALGKMTWADPEGGADTYGLYLLPQSFFTSKHGEGYQIHLRYSPDQRMSGFRGFVHIRCGGSI
jgi:hypothetical protein